MLAMPMLAMSTKKTRHLNRDKRRQYCDGGQGSPVCWTYTMMSVAMDAALRGLPEAMADDPIARPPCSATDGLYLANPRVEVPKLVGCGLCKRSGLD